MQQAGDALLRDCRLPLCGRRMVSRRALLIKLRKLGEAPLPWGARKMSGSKPKIVSSFTMDTALNDVLVHTFVCGVVNK